MHEIFRVSSEEIANGRQSSLTHSARLAEDVADATGEDNLKKLFDVKNEFSKHEIMDQVKVEYKYYQVENLSDGFYELTADKDGNVNRNRRPSYGKNAYSLLNIDITQSQSSYCRINEYWWKVYLKCLVRS